MGINITKNDLIWSYLAKFIQLCSGLFVLPLVLKMLSPEEVGMNYLMLSVSSLVALLDFGFSPQFGRNFTYVNSGAKRLLNEGVEYSDDRQVDYHLLAVLLQTAKYVYKKLSIVCEAFMLLLGTIYMYVVTDGFTNVNNSLVIWLLFSVSTYFTIYFTYYNSLLTGSGMIKEASIATILSRLVNIIISVVMLYYGGGLLSIVIASLVAPFVQRYYSYVKYFTPELREKLKSEIHKSEITELYSVIWYNAKKLGINFLGSYAINRSGLFIIGLYLTLSEVGEYGLMTQLAGILSGVAQVPFATYQPKFADCRVSGNREHFIKLMTLTIAVYWFIMISGALFIAMWGKSMLSFIGSNTQLPGTLILIVYLLSVILEGNHSMFATLIVTDNKVPFVKASLVSGFAIVVLTVIVLSTTNLRLLGVVCIPFLVQLFYNNWRWPLWVINDFGIKDTIRYGKEAFIFK